MLQPGDTIGILGGGQLGRMMALAASRIGLKSHIYCPDPNSPAFDVTAFHTCASYEDEAALEAFARSVQRVTYEFENIPAPTVEFLKARLPVLPGDNVLKTSQDRLTEKNFFASIDIPTAGFYDISSEQDLRDGVAKLGLPALLKTRRFGYDGKGQVFLKNEADLTGALDAIGNQPAILEAFVPFEREISVIAARNEQGQTVSYDIAENVHKNQILKTTTVPAHISPEVAAQARQIGEKVAQALDYVGVLAVELFLLPDSFDQRLVANEMAPRVHNSGHWTESACLVSQFEQHIRAVAGWPLGDTRRHSDVVMTNLIGDDINAWPKHLSHPSSSLHSYGKSETRDGRKMGHLNQISPIKGD
ncbi:5-(carboxyamino)imidazole ribonucleotide synthase [Cohaesibacter celericrescens]|uniref:N5-carboxyaminoimidazole ribonucleotide synthase n=1 Tax=Cohaesibacter celericrescens TaxID=2067669 RepID=A0A2N5XLE5_9HYPH|nr:5-(carboxyamino)imidazole ribonucleotide synthase [Cohaesibacter celericrescens]PLW75250.1 5-(carboxyamino)imidazole ribonucleotide synthase [Cohaesibacter celericrescens]